MCKTTDDDNVTNYDFHMSGKDEDAGGFGRDFFSEDFTAALDNSNVSIYIIDPETFSIVYCNRTLCGYIGCDPTGEPCYRALMKRDTPCEACAAMSLYRDGDSTPKEAFNPAGVWGMIYASSLRWKGRELVQVTCVDITRQKQLEAELRLHNKEYRAVALQSTSGIMRYDIATGTAAVNVDSNLNRVEEYTVPNYVQVIRDSGMIGEESLPTAKAMFKDICSATPSRGYDLLLVLANGDKRWCHLDYVLIGDDEGRPYRAVVSFYDNTEKQEREIAYQKWNARLNTLMAEYTAYMEVNFTQNRIEAEGRIGAWDQNVGGRCFTEFVDTMAEEGIFEEDILVFRRFFNRERLIGQFYAGYREASLEYRAIVEESSQWYKAELQMVSDPVTGDVKASIVFSNVDETMRERERLTREAERDAMTRLYNHAVSEQLIRQVLEQDTEERCGFLVIDLDDLRDINSLLGHPEGDRALMAIADTMREHFSINDICGRIGGDEFVVFVRDVLGAAALRNSISSFMSRIRKIRIGPKSDQSIHVSVGAAVGRVGREKFQTLYERADLALYYAKAMGKDTFQLYVPELENREFKYSPHSTATLTRTDWYESAEFKKLLRAMATFFPLVISANLTKNTYYIMEYKAFATQRARDEGSFDQLILDGAGSFHPEDRAGFLECFARDNLLCAFREGKKTVEHVGRQLGDDGIYRTVQTVAIFMKDEETGDICEVSFTHIISSEADRRGSLCTKRRKVEHG